MGYFPHPPQSLERHAPHPPVELSPASSQDLKLPDKPVQFACWCLVLATEDAPRHWPTLVLHSSHLFRPVMCCLMHLRIFKARLIAMHVYLRDTHTHSHTHTHTHAHKCTLTFIHAHINLPDPGHVRIHTTHFLLHTTCPIWAGSETMIMYAHMHVQTCTHCIHLTTRQQH